MTHDNKENGMESIITYEEVLEKVTKIVDERGRDYVYDEHQGPSAECRYFVDGKPSCIVGHLVHALGDEEFESAVRFKEADTMSFTADILGEMAPLEEDAVRFLTKIQNLQDKGLSWGDALDASIDYMESGSI